VVDLNFHRLRHGGGNLIRKLGASPERQCGVIRSHSLLSVREEPGESKQGHGALICWEFGQSRTCKTVVLKRKHERSSITMRCLPIKAFSLPSACRLSNQPYMIALFSTLTTQTSSFRAIVVEYTTKLLPPKPTPMRCRCHKEGFQLPVLWARPTKSGSYKVSPRLCLQ